MNEFIRMFLRMFIQVGPYLVVFVVLGYIIKLQEKKAKEREEEQKKGIIKTHYVVKTEKILAIMFVVGTIFFACCMAMGIAQQEDGKVIVMENTENWVEKYKERMDKNKPSEKLVEQTLELMKHQIELQRKDKKKC